MRFSVYAFAWDIAWRGPKAVAAELRQAGVDACHVGLVYHAVSAIVPDAPSGALFTRDRGHFYFEPLSVTDFGGLSAEVDEFAASEAELARWTAIFADQGIALIPWIVPTHDMAGAPSDWCQVGSLGDRYMHALCPANPAVGRYVGSIVADLGARNLFPMVEVEHVGFGAFDHWRFAHHPKAPVPALEPATTQLLSLCFCASCRSAADGAGIDADRLRDALKPAILQALASGEAPHLAEEFLQELDGFQQVRRVCVTAHVARVRTASPLPLSWSPLFPIEVSGFDAQRCLGPGEELAVLGYGQSPGEIGRALDRLAAGGIPGGATRLVVELGGRRDLADVMDVAADRGVSKISFYNFGLCSRTARADWSGQIAHVDTDRASRISNPRQTMS